MPQVSEVFWRGRGRSSLGINVILFDVVNAIKLFPQTCKVFEGLLGSTINPSRYYEQCFSLHIIILLISFFNSIGVPKGAMTTHRNLVANVAAIYSLINVSISE